MNKLTEIIHRFGATEVLIKQGFYTEGEKLLFNDMRYLLSLLEEKNKSLKESNEALEFYADTETWDMKHVRGNFYQALAHEDNGEVARKALNTSSNNEGEN